VTAPRRVLFVGLDAMDPGLLQRWARAGELPNLARLLAQGLVGRTESPRGVFVGALWPSLVTGVNPGKHGRHSWEQLVPGTYEVRRFHSGDDPTPEPFWLPLCRAGRRVVLLDVPLTGVTPHPRLLQVLEWGCHDPERGFRTHPAALADEILAQVGPHPVQGNCNARRDGAAHARFRDDLVRGVALRTQLHELLLARGEWDLFFTVYGESHCVGHQCWHVHDPSHPLHDPEVAARIGDPILDVYRAIDASVGALLARVGPETLAIVLASHGMRPHFDPTFLLEEILLRLEAAEASAFSRACRAVARRLGRRVRKPTRAERRCFRITNNQVDGAIRLNLRGREPHGRVAPGAEAEAVCAQLARDLGEVVDLDTGKPVVARILETRRLYHGDRLDWLPDLLVEWTKGGPVSRVGSPKIGTLERAYAGVRTGDHTPEGWFAAVGAGLAPGSVSRSVDVMDFAPTLAARLGAELADADGAPIEELLRGARP
jgi:predicted AlkP superfamily phosphohydrolase/phosphomutase